MLINLSDLPSQSPVVVPDAPAQAPQGAMPNVRGSSTRAGSGDIQMWIPYGEDGTAATIAEMSRIAVHSSRDPVVRLLTYEVIKGIPGRNHKQIAERLFYWLQDHGSGERSGIKFINDGFQTEQVRAPWWSIFIEGAGDCNSGFSTALAAMLMSVGIPAFFRTVAADARRPKSFSHVYTVAIVNGKELPLDPSVGFSSPSSEPTEITRKKDWKINIFSVDDLANNRKPLARLGSWLSGLFS